MKQKKVAALLLTMALCAGMAVPQSVVAFAAETGISEATLESDEVSYTDTFYDSGKVKEAYCTNTEEIKKALKNASTLASEVSKIYITNNIDLELGEAEYLEVPLNTYVMISSYPEGKKYYLKSTKASTNASTTNGIIIGKGKELSFSNIVIDGNHQRRCIYLNSQQGVLNIGEGTIIQNGGNTTNNNIKGLGIYTNGMRANVNIANNTEITGCNLYSDKTTAGTYGKAVCVEAAAGSLNILGGKIYSNDDFFVEAEYSRSRVLTGANGTVYCSGTFNMEAGEITNNHSFGGAAVYLSGTSTIGEKAKISNNVFDSSSADQAVATDSSIASVSFHSVDAGGVYYRGSSVSKVLTIEDGAEISRNTIRGASDYVKSHKLSGGGITIEKGKVVMNGGTISYNTAESTLIEIALEGRENLGLANGGGVYIKGGSFELKGGMISSNSAKNTDAANTQAGNGGGVYVAVDGTTASGTGATFTMTGGTIKDNTASNGKDLYVSNYLKYMKSSVVSGSTVYTPVDVAGTPSVSISGKTSKIGNVFLPEKTDSTGESVMKVSGELGEEKTIGVEVANPEEGTIIAKPDEYELSEDDVKAFIYNGKLNEDEQLILAKDDVGQIALLGKNYAAATSIETAEISWKDGSSDKVVTYSGDEQKPEVEVGLNGELLEEGKDYSIRYLNNTNAGTAKVRISGNNKTGNYKGTIDKEFTIQPLDIGTEDVQEKAINPQLYTGNVITPGVKLTYKGAELKAGTDYTASYSNNTEAGTATVTIVGTGNFTGERTISFEITNAEDAEIVGDSIALEKAVENAEGGKKTVIALKNDITLSADEAENLDGVLKLRENAEIEIDGYGHSITLGKEQFATADKSATGMFVIPSGAKLTLETNMHLDGAGKGRIAYVDKDGTLTVGADVTMTGGRATDQTDDSAAYGGQCIYNLGTTEFYGIIRDNETKFNGHGVIYNNHAFSLGSGAKIVDVTVYKRGAVYNDINGDFTMEDASISGTVSVVPGQTAGVGVYDKVNDALDAKAIFNYGTFTMKSGEITGNPGDYPTITNSGIFTMAGGKITGNENNFKTAGGNGNGTIYQRRYDITDPDVKQPEFTMAGGEISGNKVMYNGGGVFLADGTFTMDGENAVIRDNTVTSKGNEDSIGNAIQYFNNGGGVFVQGGTFELKNGTIEGNQAYLLTENGTQKQAFNGGTWYFNSNGTPSQTGNQSPGQGSGSNKHYGLGAAIYIGSGTLKLSGGNVNGNLSAPLNKDATQPAFKAASGIYVAGEGVVEMSGAPVISDVIYLEQGKNITIADKLTGTEPYTVYQTENDLKLKEDVTSAIGKAVATYKADSNAYQENDGDRFKLYAYDDTYDYAANKAYTHYTAFADDGIYVNIDDIDVKDLKYTFVDSVMTAGVPSYVYNGKARNVKISAPVEGWLDKSGNTVDAGGSLAFTADQDAIINAGPYNVTVKPDLTKPGGYHYTGETSLQFAITQRDLSVPIYERDDESNIKYDEDKNPVIDRLYATSFSFTDDIKYGENDPVDMEYKPASNVQVNLGILTPTTLAEGTDYEVTYSNNKSGSKENITATITGKGNYQGVLVKNFDTGIKVKNVQTLTTSIAETNITAGAPAVSIGAETTDNTATITYKSSDESVATVDENGQVTPLSKGTVQITVTAPETNTSRPVQQIVTFNVAANPAVVDQEAADNVTRLVNNLNTDAMTVDNLSTSKTSVNHARAAYEALTDAQKAKVPQDTLDKLTAAEQKIKALEDEAAAIEKQKADQAAAAKVETALNALPTADQMNADSYADAIKAITAAESAYNTLTDAQKAYVSADAKEKLDAAKAKAAEIEAQVDQNAVDLVKAQAVSDQIAKMPKATEISKQTITEDEAAVKAARAAYDALTVAQKAKVPQEAVAALAAAENKVAEVQKAIADTAAEEIPEISLVQKQNDAVKPVTNKDGSQGLALDLDENGQIIITLGDNTHPILDAENKAIDNDYVFNTAVEEINQNGDVIPSDLEVAEIFNIDWYVNGEKQEFDDSMYVTFGAASVKSSDTKVIVLHQHDGKWTQLDVADYGDGWVKAKFDGFSPAIVLVAHNASEDTTGGSDAAGTGGNTDTSGSGGADSSGDNGSDTSGADGNTDTSGNDGSSTGNGGSSDTSGNNGSDNGTTGDNGSGDTSGTTTDNAGDANDGTTTQDGTVQGTTSPYATSGQGTWSGTGTTATPVSSTAATNAVSTPKTGDRTNMPAAYATLLAALAALFGAGVVNKRRREEETE